MSQDKYDIKEESGTVTLHPKPQYDEAISFLKTKFGFTNSHPSTKRESAQAVHGDKGKVVVKAASQMFLLVELPGMSGRLYKVVKDEEEAQLVIDEMIKSETECDYCYQYYTAIGSSIYLCQDIKEFRFVASDDTDNA